MAEKKRERTRVLHVLANSSPNINGYAVRSHDMLIAQLNSQQVFPIAITSPYYPELTTMAVSHEIDGIEYFRCLHPAYRDSNSGMIRKLIAWKGRKRIAKRSILETKGREFQRPSGILKKFIWNLKWGTVHLFRSVKRAIRVATRPIRHIFSFAGSFIVEKTYSKMFEKEIEDLILNFKPDIVHAHTPHRVGIPAMNAAKRMEIPFIYEMRGVWEDTAVINGRWRSWGLSYKWYKMMENKVLRGADHVYCISEQLKKDLISRGIDEKGITIVRNAVNDELFTNDGGYARCEKVLRIIEDLKLNDGTTVIGYIGSIQPLEGLETLVRAISNINNDLDARLLIVSTEKNQEYFREFCESQGIGTIATIVGPVSREVISQCYSLIDIFVVCRPPGYRVTEIVTPLKPFEAMARGLPVIVSDLPALKEIVEHNSTGLWFEAGNHVDLSEKISELTLDKKLRLRLGKEAQKWIFANRLWSKVIVKSIEGYQQILARFANEK